MTDRMINKAWWMTVMGLIVTAGVAGLFLIYRSMFDFLGGRWQVGLMSVIAGIGCAAATVALCRHRDELVRF